MERQLKLGFYKEKDGISFQNRYKIIELIYVNKRYNQVCIKKATGYIEIIYMEFLKHFDYIGVEDPKKGVE